MMRQFLPHNLPHNHAGILRDSVGLVKTTDAILLSETGRIGMFWDVLKKR